MNIALKYPPHFLDKTHVVLLSAILAGGVGGALAFPASYFHHPNVWIGLCLLPFVIQREGTPRIPFHSIGSLLFLGTIAFVMEVRMLYFFVLGFYLVVVLELVKGKLNSLVLFLLLFMSPVFQHVATTFGFPVRLQVSAWAGHLLASAGWGVKIEGNTILLQGNSFAVDEACMGLHMLTFSLLMGVFLIAHQSRQQGKPLSFLSLVGFFLLVFLLNLVSNLMRILLLVVFNIPPENALHEIMGLFCLGLYVVLPMWWGSKWWGRKMGKTRSLKTHVPVVLSLKAKMMIVLLAIFMVATGFRIGQAKNAKRSFSRLPCPKGFTVTELKDGVCKWENEQALVYVKPISDCFSSEHTPLICWRGSGYEFQQVQTAQIAGQEVYMGQLKKAGTLLYTAWWYDNGKTRTIIQYDWRMRMAKGENRFYLLNVSANSSEVLRDQLVRLFNQNLIPPN